MAVDRLVLIDSSVWVAALRAGPNAAARQAVTLLLDEDRAATAGIIAAELLQGCRDQRQADELGQDLDALHWLLFADEWWRTVGRMGQTLRRQGAAVPVTDLAIACVAIEHRCLLLHNDRHFELIARHTGLKHLWLR